jgi:cell wall-associated NlpC family hydrolase
MLDEESQRQKVVEYAKTWIGTPFRDQADTRGSGVDCCMFLVRVFVDTGIIPPFDPRPYEPRFFLHKSDENYLLGKPDQPGIAGLGREIAEKDAKPGDIVIYKHGRCFSHTGLIISDEQIIHAWFVERKVSITERRSGLLTTDRGKPRPSKFFTFWGPR